MRKENNVMQIAEKILFALLSAFICALAIKLIVQPNKFLSGGVSGVAILISRYIAIRTGRVHIEAALYSLLYVILNVPVFVFGFKKVGRQFVLYSLVNVLIFSFFVSTIPAAWYGNFQLNKIDPLTLAILAGILSGTGAVIAFSRGFSLGGTDIISMYLSRSKGKGIGNYSLAINAVILFFAGVVFKDFASLIYTIIYFFVSSLVVNNLYIGHKKTLIEVVTTKEEALKNKLMKESHHGCTILDCIGAYSNESKKMIRIVVSSSQIKGVCEIINSIDKDSFTTIININQVNGKFYIPPLK